RLTRRWRRDARRRDRGRLPQAACWLGGTSRTSRLHPSGCRLAPRPPRQLDLHRPTGYALGRSFSMMSRTIRWFLLAAAALRIARSAFAVRPSLPITLPRSSSATRNSRVGTPSRTVSVTLTASGFRTRNRATYSTSSFIAATRRSGCRRRRRSTCGEARTLQYVRHRFGWPRTPCRPTLELLAHDSDARGIGRGIVRTELLDVSAVTREARVRDDDPVKRMLLRTMPRQSNRNGHFSGSS